MTIENENFFITMSKEDMDYMPEVISFLSNSIKDIMSFFGITALSNKKRIIIWSNLEEYQKHTEVYRRYEDWMCADTYDQNINMLSIKECRKTEAHKDMTLDEFKGNILHEFVHICQQECELDYDHENNSWFYEALATNLGDPSNKQIVEVNVTKEELRHHIYERQDGYFIVFTIGKYMLENYSHETIIEYVKYPKTLDADIGKIIAETKEWVSKMNNHVL